MVGGVSSNPDPLASARAAAHRHDWKSAFRDFESAATDLSPDDLERWATAGYLLGRVDSALEALERAYRTNEQAGATGDAARCAFWSVFILVQRGEMARATGWLGRCAALAEASPEDGPARAYLDCVGAFRRVAIEGAYEDGLEMAEGVIGHARSAGDRDLLALGLNIAGRALVKAGRVEEGMGRFDEAMVELMSGELAAPVAGTVYCSMIDACEEVSELARAREWTEALNRWCDRQEGMITFTGQCLTHRATILRHSGRWDLAGAEAERACEQFVGAADEAATGRALYELGETRRLSGRYGEAEDAYRRAGTWGHDPQPGLALLRLAQGQAESAAASMQRRVAETNDPLEMIKLLPAHAEIMLAVGNREAARSSAEELSGLADRFGTDCLRAQAAYATGTLALAEGEGDRAVSALRTASRTWQSLRCPFEEARSRTHLGRACRVVGDEEAAALEESAARRLLEQLGVEPGVMLGDHTEPAHGLSERELEVLRLVATGRTNQEIADELYLAVKTIDRHVGNILAKLAVSSRTAATAFAYEHGLI
jgi:DNA-binding NarL/FixJ family response regulator